MPGLLPYAGGIGRGHKDERERGKRREREREKKEKKGGLSVNRLARMQRWHYTKVKGGHIGL